MRNHMLCLLLTTWCGATGESVSACIETDVNARASVRMCQSRPSLLLIMIRSLQSCRAWPKIQNHRARQSH